MPTSIPGYGRAVARTHIPNPTLEVVARPGAQEEHFRHGNPAGLMHLGAAA